MFRKKVALTAAIALGAATLATAVNELTARLRGYDGQGVENAISAFLISLIVGTPIFYFLVGQRIQIQDARDQLLESQKRRDAALADLQAASHELVEQREAAVAANVAKSAFLAMMSHELRTPMNGVLGMAHALTLTDLDERQGRHVEMLVRSGKGLMAILNDILDISKIEAGRLELEIIPFDLQDLGKRVHDLWAETASAKGVCLTYDFAPGSPSWVSGDPTRLRQIMANLVSNALKFTAEGEVRLAIGMVSAGQFEIRVSDTGPGLSPAQQASLFQAFVQADASTTRQYGGTGLGLAICRRLATLMDGEIAVESRLGEGAIFTVSVPLPEAERPAEAEDEPAVEADLTGLSVLVADDNAINQAVARAILESFGMAVTTAPDGFQALELLRGDRFDLVLLDIHMPRMGGLEALAQIRAGRAGRAEMPVIALTADAMVGVDATLLAAGFDEVAPKPIIPADLADRIARSLCLTAPVAERRAGEAAP